MTLANRIHADDCRHPHDPERIGLREQVRERIETDFTPTQIDCVRIALGLRTRAATLDALTDAEIERIDRQTEI